MTFISRRFVLYGPFALLAAAGLAIGSMAYAFVRLATSNTGATGLFWAGGDLPIRFSIHPSGSDDMPEDDREGAAIRLAFDAWGSIDGSALSFTEVADQGAKVAQSDGRNLVFFDETNATGRFTNAPFIVAITPVFFDGGGRIGDADIIFNGRDHAFTATPGAPGESGKFDVQNIATHEIGHFVGLDHSGIHGGTMIPFAIPGETRLRSLSEDEVAAARALYPGGAPVGRVTGTVQHAGGGGVSGAHVVVATNASGTPVAAGITRSNGQFEVLGVPAATSAYRVYVEPFDGPTEDANLQRDGIETGFQTRFAGAIDAPSSVSVESGLATDVGTIVVPAGTGLNIEGVTPRTVRRGQTTQLFVTGSQMNGCEVEVRGAGVTHDPVVALGRFSVNVSASAAPGLRDIYLRRGSGASREMVVLAGGLEIIAAAPQVTAAIPERIPQSGATVEVVGQGFAAGARVVAGDAVVPAFDVVFTSPTSLTVAIPAADQPGEVALTVINPDGQEARLEGALTYTGDPQPTSVDPRQGPSAGGVPATIEGGQFASGATVRFGDRLATGVAVTANGTRITCTTPPGTVGQKVSITVTNPDGSSGVLAGAYTYLAPAVAQLAPAIGSTSGGAEIQVLGEAFAPGATVRFGTTAAPQVTFVSQNEVRAIAPARASAGFVAVSVTNPDGAAGVSGPTAFQYIDGVQPAITSVAPSSGSSAGGDTLTLAGRGFEAGALVRVGGALAASVEVVSASEIRCVTPAGSGVANVTVQNPSGLEDTAFAAFTYVSTVADSGGGGGGGFGCALDPRAARPDAAALFALALVAGLGLRRRRAAARV